jgi:hypothetical protein
MHVCCGHHHRCASRDHIVLHLIRTHPRAAGEVCVPPVSALQTRASRAPNTPRLVCTILLVVDPQSHSTALMPRPPFTHAHTQPDVTDGELLDVIYPDKLRIWECLLKGEADSTWVFLPWELAEAQEKVRCACTCVDVRVCRVRVVHSLPEGVGLTSMPTPHSTSCRQGTTPSDRLASQTPPSPPPRSA